jgi:hypothetical protein
MAKNIYSYLAILIIWQFGNYPYLKTSKFSFLNYYKNIKLPFGAFYKKIYYILNTNNLEYL